MEREKMKGNIVSEHDYDKLFDKVREFKKKQNAQKQRGLNDYNMVNIVRSEAAEVGMHSNVIYSLIDPYGLHYQDDLFLQHFIGDVLGIDDFGSSITVEAEEHTCDNRRIDFTIKSDKYYIGIEMKVDAHDLKHQLFDYYEDLIKKAEDEEEVIIYYLTKNGREASEYSYKKDGKSIEYRQISFEKHILNWIDSCQKEVRNITNLNEAFSNYRSIVEKITNKYHSKIDGMNDFFLKKGNEDIFKLAQEFYVEYDNKAYAELLSLEKEVCDHYGKARKKLTERFFEVELIKYLQSILDDSYKFKGEFNQASKYRITITNTKNSKKIIFYSEHYSTTQDRYQIDDEKNIPTRYRYRYGVKSINHFFENNGEEAKKYYLGLINGSLNFS